MVFNDDIIERYFLEYDVTNGFEIAGMSILIILNIILLLRLLLNFRSILVWYLQNDDVDPKKLVCINSTLLISVILRLMTENYSLWGCILSGFQHFEDGKPTSGSEYVYNNIILYRILEQFYIQFQNLAMLIASKFWLYVIQAKYIYEQQLAPSMNIDQHGKHGSFSGKPSTYLTQSFVNSRGGSIVQHPTALKFLKGCSMTLRLSWVLVIVVTFYSCTVLVMNQETVFAKQFSSALIILTTILSGIAFSGSCLVIYFDLDAFYTVDPKYKQRVYKNVMNIKEQMRHAALFLVGTQILRFAFNSMQLFGSHYLYIVKSGNNKVTIPDQTFKIFRALIVPGYSFVVDFIPTFCLSELFSPLPTTLDHVNPQSPIEDWDIKSIE